jgi:hypothetical protein
MKGLEPTTFCMANARDRSHPFASVRSNHLFAATTGRPSEPQRTRANAECSHCSLCDRCHVQLAWWRYPALATAADFRLGRDCPPAAQDFPANPRDRIYEPYGPRDTRGRRSVVRVQRGSRRSWPLPGPAPGVEPCPRARARAVTSEEYVRAINGLRAVIATTLSLCERDHVRHAVVCSAKRSASSSSSPASCRPDPALARRPAPLRLVQQRRRARFRRPSGSPR